jgi:hypothetical protein
MLDAGVDPGALVPVLSTIMIECAINIVRRSDQRTGSPIEIKNFLHELIEGQETITGGTVIIGIDHSEVRGGKVTRTKLDCGSNLFELTGSTAQVAGRALRSLPRPETEPSRGGILSGNNGL